MRKTMSVAIFIASFAMTAVAVQADGVGPTPGGDAATTDSQPEVNTSKDKKADSNTNCCVYSAQTNTMTCGC
ncbi:hypothetical protein [Dongia sp. agr-C8]